jgi:hypothetical protein
VSDIVERLARDNDFAVFMADDGMPALRLMSEADRRQDAADEIERLRAAGDALAEVADEWPELVEAWQEVRRER